MLGFDFDERDIQFLVLAQDRGLEGPAVRGLHLEAGFAAADTFDDMVVGEDFAILGNDHAGAGPLNSLLIVLGSPGTRALGPEEPIEEFISP